MSLIEKAELIVIAICFIVFLLLKNTLPVPATLATAILSLSALLLLQGLIRDLTYLARHKKDSSPDQAQALFGICVESFLGIIGIVIGGVLIFFYSHNAFQLSTTLWAVLILSVLVFGFLIKDYVFDFSTMKIHKDVEHMNIIVSRKKP